MSEFYVGTVKKLLQQISKERGIRIDEVVINFPVESKDHVSYVTTNNEGGC